jgi:HD-GYP domain-containing protein (c-di-GMP phosphodiesterase class II)
MKSNMAWLHCFSDGHGGLLLLVFFELIGAQFAKIVIKPIYQMLQHVKKIASGDSSLPVQGLIGNDISQLADIDFMQMSMVASNKVIFNAGDHTIQSLLIAFKLSKKTTACHAMEVNTIALDIAQELDLSKDQIRHLNWGTLLHDLGKLAIPDSILLKPGPLNASDMDLIRRHPLIGYQILKDASYLKDTAEILLYHHERYDGHGYPYGLAGEAIPYLARICTVADAFQAMIADRPYRMGITIKEAVAEVIKCSGTQFDPQVVAAFLLLDHSRYVKKSLKSYTNNQ